MLILRNISYIHPNGDEQFIGINLTVNRHNKTALIGNNGSGKSTLFKLITGELHPFDGFISAVSEPYYVPQIFGQFDHLTVAQALRVYGKLNALHKILNGDVTEENYMLLDDDWTIEERCIEALQAWQLDGISLNQTLGSLSGGQKTKVFLAGIRLHNPELVLMDEPGNHLDREGRELLYGYISTTQHTLVVISHDRALLNLLNPVCELSKHGITVYGGNYDFYAEQKRAELESLGDNIQAMKKDLRKAKEKERETMERQQKLDARGKQKQEKAGVARIMMNTLRNKAENSTSKLKQLHSEKIAGMADELKELQSSLPDLDQMKLGLKHSGLHAGKVLLKAEEINFSYGSHTLWAAPFTFQINSGERICVKGPNGSGKTTLIQLLLGNAEPTNGSIYKAEQTAVYIDQDYSLLNTQLTVYEHAQQYNTSGLLEHEIKTKLNRFLFTVDDWDKTCGALSGGEKMRLLLCCLTIGEQAPDLIVLDEPTNNLDLKNIEILTKAIQSYTGTLIVVSHDEVFLQEVGIERVVQL
jgi:ATPase subunit of ABC transporter with duplicated ATPase domains